MQEDCWPTESEQNSSQGRIKQGARRGLFSVTRTFDCCKCGSAIKYPHKPCMESLPASQSLVSQKNSDLTAFCLKTLALGEFSYPSHMAFPFHHGMVELDMARQGTWTGRAAGVWSSGADPNGAFPPNTQKRPKFKS